MLLSFSLIIICGLSIGGIMKRVNLPSFLGMLISGMILGPYVLNLIAPEILSISANIRQIALTVILLRAGLSLDISALKKLGRSAVLMCFLPALFEIAATIFFAPLIFDITYLEAAIMGTVLGAVSPAVAVPRMLKINEQGYGKTKGIPQLIMAGASVDDVFVIVLFTSFMDAYKTKSFDFMSVFSIPISIGAGIGLGALVGFTLVFIIKKINLSHTSCMLLVLAAAILLVALEGLIKPYFSISGLLAAMSLGFIIFKFQSFTAKKLSNQLKNVWIFAEIFLFVLVGATLNLKLAAASSGLAIVLIFTVLCFRSLGVWLCLVKTSLNSKERFFCVIAYLPKATVQAAIGALPLAANISAGPIILTVAILSIIITAPLGAFGIDLTYKKLLSS